jgi:hypothetical protein
MSKYKSNLTTVEVQLVYETDLAWKTRATDGKFVWVPKSRVEVEPDPHHEFPCEVEMTLEEDLAAEKELA